ncbi:MULTISPECIES: 3-deoxy-D-manno-octulosonic acid transferase [unclassified Ruegeria]|uniref:3-deoxy-D-manno-octulosonic acid transferase n=1 Tax=unclassified Ruegeria TaxID=2625375 RepID=UPI001488704A|nr:MULTISPECIES: glycosyltransferase N-terminal domain-containing protein [unclassified Ruegeria]
MSKPRSLSLAAYRILSWGVPQTMGRDLPPRPEGELLWLHLNSPEKLPVIEDFASRLLAARPDVSLLLTAPYDANISDWSNSLWPVVPLPPDQPRPARAFLDHWQPDLCIWIGGGLMPNLINRAEEKAIPMILLEGVVDLVMSRSGRWLPDITRFTLDCFDRIETCSENTARQIRRYGIASSKVSVSSPLRISPDPQPWPEDELIETNHALGGRPVWLAAWVQDTEFISVLSAHRQAMRLLPRLALVLHVADTAEADPLNRRLEAMDLRCSNWDEGQQIEDNTQVILTASDEDLGLWHRVAPVTFMGTSLERGATGQNPLLSTALGSSVIHGPYVIHHSDSYHRLDSAGAAVTVRTATELGDAVVDLLAPDRTADMALAGWELVTEGAPQTDDLIELVQHYLDKGRANRART